MLRGKARQRSACGDAPSDAFLARAIQRAARSGHFSVEAGTRAAAPFPAPLFSASGALPPLGSGQVSLDEAEHFRSTIEKLASIRSDGVLDHPGMPFGFPPERAFSFTGIPKVQQLLISGSVLSCGRARLRPFHVSPDNPQVLTKPVTSRFCRRYGSNPAAQAHVASTSG